MKPCSIMNTQLTAYPPIDYYSSESENWLRLNRTEFDLLISDRIVVNFSSEQSQTILLASSDDRCQYFPRRPRMMGSTIVILVSMTTMAMFCNNVLAALPTQCNPGFLDELPPRIRKVCAALSRIYELGSDIESYIDDKESHITGEISLRKRQNLATGIFLENVK